jgi:hypothetical protein
MGGAHAPPIFLAIQEKGLAAEGKSESPARILNLLVKGLHQWRTTHCRRGNTSFWAW